MYYYPGNSYIDVVGEDIYNDNPAPFAYDEFTNATGKPYVISEFGPMNSAGSWDNVQTVQIFKGKPAFFLQWHSWSGNSKAIIDNPNASNFKMKAFESYVLKKNIQTIEQIIPANA